ncbi:hypothetical protein Pint_14693 [Pistacia integerrima]|uniref:Uncharacterized protein n=1 Tax=Pistacia integerrima TaxID=434235 RepID=A0ACC0Y3X3_9ROSI|nr:hypothetical protein Pint_14693 [Pistacia integerrima]
MATIATEMMLRCATDCSLSLNDFNIERRPYHKNCGCALHKLKGVCSNDCSKQNNISFAKKKSWPDSLSSLRIREDAIANGALPSTVGRSN